MLELSWRRVGAVLTRPGVIVDRPGLDKTSETFTKKKNLVFPMVLQYFWSFDAYESVAALHAS